MTIDLEDYLKSKGYAIGANKNIRRRNFRERLADIPRETIEAVVASSKNYSRVVRLLGLRPYITHQDKIVLIDALDYYGIDYSHLKQRTNSKYNAYYTGKGMTPDEVVDNFFREKGQHNLSWATVVRLINDNDLLPTSCAECGISPKWNGMPLKLEIDHINGDNKDHRLENLRRICPNCHAQTDTYKSKNKKITPISDIIESKKV